MTRTRRAVLVGGSGLIAAVVSGCMGLLAPPPVEAVEVGFLDVRRPDIGVTSATLPLVLEYHNTADSEIPDLSSEFETYINGTSVAEGGSDVGTLNAGEQVADVTDVFIDFTAVGQAIVDALQQEAFQIELDGSLSAEGATADFTAVHEYR